MDALGSPRRVALFGGRSEIGEAILQRLVEDGASEVALAVRGANRDPRDEAKDSVSVTEVEYHADDPTSIHTAVKECFDRLGGIDVAVIAVGVLGPVGDQLTLERSTTDAFIVNSTGASVTLLELAARMRAAGFGTIVLLSSIAVERLRPSNLVYGASKSTADRLALALRAELSPAGVSVIVVRPGYVRTGLSSEVPEAPFAVDVDAVASAVQRAVRSGNSQVIWVPGILRLVGVVLRRLPVGLLKRLDRS